MVGPVLIPSIAADLTPPGPPSLQCLDPEKMDRRPCKIIWDVQWEELLALELAKAGCPKPSHLIIHLKNFRKSESFVRLVKCSFDAEDDQDPQAVRICSAIHKTWKAHQLDMKTLTLRVSYALSIPPFGNFSVV